MINMVRIILVFNFLFLSSCISRLGRPILQGVITDFNGIPIENCSVGESTTDEYGKFVLSEKRYNQFLFTEIFQMEAPSLRISEIISKEGYESKEIYAYNRYGGGGRKGSIWNLDTIRLKETNRKGLNLNNSSWKISANKEMDSLYFIRSNFYSLCNTRKCKDFYGYYSQYSQNYPRSSSKRNLPKGVIRKLIDINFQTEKNNSIQKIIQYDNREASWSSRKRNDTITTNGTWNFNNEKNTFEFDFDELNGVYEIAEFDYEYILMIKNTANNGKK